MVLLKKIFSLLLIIFVILVICTSCVKLQTRITLNKDGSGSWEYIVTLNDNLLEMDDSIGYSFADIKKEAENTGFIVNDYKEDGYTGIILQKDFKNIEEISTSGFLPDLPRGNTENIDPLFKPHVEVKKGGFSTVYKILIEIKPGVEKETDLLFLNQMYDMKFVFKSPFLIEKHNANIVSEDGKMLAWELSPNKDTSIELEYKKLNNRNFLVFLLIILVIIAIILLIILKKHSVPEEMMEMDEITQFQE